MNIHNFQMQVRSWVKACFGSEIGDDRIERNHRFLEEALELVQSLGCSRADAYQLVDYVFDRPPGDPQQEVGGVGMTLAALCGANRIDMEEAFKLELDRVWNSIEKIRQKQAQKPKGSPLPSVATMTVMDSHGAVHILSIDYVQSILRTLFDRMPGGLDELKRASSALQFPVVRMLRWEDNQPDVLCLHFDNTLSDEDRRSISLFFTTRGSS